jgi:signal transduction histidine kinase
MKLYRQKLFIILTAVFYMLVGAASARAQNREISILEIMEQWTAIEHAFMEKQVKGENNFDFDEIDALGGSLNAFLNSETYRIFRFAPLSSGANRILGPSEPNEIPEIHAAAALLPAFREALSNGETEKAMLVSSDVTRNLVMALARSTEAERYAHTAYLRLLLVFIAFIIITALLSLFLYRALSSSLRREAYGSWFSQSFILAQEAERSRLSRELHDTVAQDLRCLLLGMDKIGNCSDREERVKLCTEAAASHSALIRRVRDICDYLVPPDFRFQGIENSLRQLCLDYGKRTGIDCRVEIAEDVDLERLGEDKQLQIFRIIQEALTNVEKHSGATEAIVIIRRGSDNIIRVGISDDGKGFIPVVAYDLRTPYEDAHLGIRGMNERAALLGGSLLIKSEPGEGTLVCLEIPVTAE